MNKNILLCVSGGIAVYKAVALVSKLSQAGANVKVIMTESAKQFVNPLSFQVMSKNDVFYDTFDEKDSRVIAHIDLADWADLILVAPATANIIGKLANGIADDMVTTTLLAATAPVWLAPAMNVHMYDHPAVQRNLARLAADGYEFIEPSEGFLACGYVGKGRLEEPEKITSLVLEHFTATAKPLAGKMVLVTTGACSVPLDEHHVISTVASGVIGKAIADEAKRLGADVQVFGDGMHDASSLVEKVENFKKQHPNTIFVHAANMPTVEHAPKMSVEQTALSITFGQSIIGQATYNVESTNWIEQSEEAKINGQVVDAKNARHLAKTLWSIVLEEERS